VTLRGEFSAVNDHGTHDRTRLEGNHESANLFGDDSSVVSTGDGNTVRLRGTGETAVARGDNDSVIDSGTGNRTVLAGSGDMARLAGASIGGELSVTGDGATINLQGTDGTAIVTGDNAILLDVGSGDTIVLRGDNERANVFGSNAHVTSTGYGNTISVGGIGDTVDASNATVSLGAGVDAALHGHDNTIAMGVDATLNLSGFRNEVIDASGADDADVLALGGHFGHEQLWFAESNGDLVISVIGRERSVTIDGWFDSPDNHISTLQTGDGFSISDEGIDQLVQAMAAFSPPADGHNHLSNALHEALDPVLAANWQHA
jgi:lipopolysaccharide export system protein LptA